MRPSDPRPRLSLEHLLLAGTLALFIAGSAWLAHDTCRPSPEQGAASLSQLPSLRLPLFRAFLGR